MYKQTTLSYCKLLYKFTNLPQIFPNTDKSLSISYRINPAKLLVVWCLKTGISSVKSILLCYERHLNKLFMSHLLNDGIANYQMGKKCQNLNVTKSRIHHCHQQIPTNMLRVLLERVTSLINIQICIIWNSGKWKTSSEWLLWTSASGTTYIIFHWNFTETLYSL